LIGECPLLALALAAATDVATQLPVWRSPLMNHSDARVLLTLLTYSYAAGVYASEDIEANCYDDPATRYLAGNMGYRAAVLRAFRRANRPWIELALADVLARAAGAQPSPGADSPLAASQSNLSPSTWLRAAQQRVQTAVLFDLELTD